MQKEKLKPRMLKPESFKKTLVFLRNIIINISICIFFTTITLYLSDLLLTSSVITKNYGSVAYEKKDNDINRKITKEIRQKRKKITDDFRVDHGVPTKKMDNERRIIVLGDSYIWGDGLLNVEDIWSRQLAKIILSKTKNVKVLDFGLCGWSTMDEFKFLEKKGIKYLPDLVIFGFVSNDPVTQENIKYIAQYKHILNKNFDFYFPFLKYFPNLYRFLSKQIAQLLRKHTNRYKKIGYDAFENKLYEKENLERYGQLLKKIKIYLKKRNIPFFFITLPNAPSGDFPKRYDLLFPIMDKYAIPVLDTYPTIMKKFGHIPDSEWKFKLSANPANGHPGRILCKVFAEECYKHLRKNYNYLFNI